MNIVKTLEKYREKDSYNKFIYGIIIAVKDGTAFQNVFVDTTKLLDVDTVWININNLNSEEFLTEHGIEFILEGKDKNIIPLGLIDFLKPREYCHNELNIWNRDGIELHKANQIIKNIERAIEIKYEAVKFINRFSEVGLTKFEDINLDLSLDDFL